MSRDVHIDGLGEVSDDACYRAVDWLHAVRGELEKQVYFQVADLLNLQVDLLWVQLVWSELAGQVPSVYFP